MTTALHGPPCCPQLKLDKISDSVSGQTVVDPKGYLTDLKSVTLKSGAHPAPWGVAGAMGCAARGSVVHGWQGSISTPAQAGVAPVVELFGECSAGQRAWRPSPGPHACTLCLLRAASQMLGVRMRRHRTQPFTPARGFHPPGHAHRRRDQRHQKGSAPAQVGHPDQPAARPRLDRGRPPGGGGGQAAAGASGMRSCAMPWRLRCAARQRLLHGKSCTPFSAKLPAWL